MAWGYIGFNLVVSFWLIFAFLLAAACQEDIAEAAPTSVEEQNREPVANHLDSGDLGD